MTAPEPQPLSRGIVKRPYTLADGRQLFYYDDADTTLPPERAADERVLGPRPPTATMRQDVLTGEWVSIAAARQNRVFLPPASQDPLAPATPENPSEIPSNYDVAVFENKSPSFGPLLDDENAPEGQDDLTEVGFGRTRTSIGRCEVVCFSPEHTGSFGTQSESRARTVVEAWADRTAALSAMPGIAQVFPFENRGIEIGVTLSHPHGQIYAYPMIPPRTRAMLGAAVRHTARTGGRNLYADVLAAEQAARVRVVGSNEHWTAYVPAASRWPFEVQLAPHRQVPDIPALSDAERDAFGPLYLDVLRRFDALFDMPMPYISAWHQAVVGDGRDLGYLHLQLFSIRRAADKLKFLAGSESAMGAFVNDIVPEKAAEMLRDAL